MSQQFIGSIAILLVSVLKLLKIDIGNDELVTILTGFAALWVAIRRYKQGDITAIGSRK